MLQLRKTPVSEIFKPEYTIEGNHVKLLMPKLTDGVTVSVQDFTNTVYYNQTLTPNNGELVVQFDLNPENADAYVISVKKRKHLQQNHISKINFRINFHITSKSLMKLRLLFFLKN